MYKKIIPLKGIIFIFFMQIIYIIKLLLVVLIVFEFVDEIL